MLEISMSVPTMVTAIVVFVGTNATMVIAAYNVGRTSKEKN